MEPAAQEIAATGGLKRLHHPEWKPRASVFKTLVRMWVIPDIGAAAILLRLDWSPLAEKGTFFENLAAFPFEGWCAAGILLLHLVFYLLARHFAQTEMPRPVSIDDEPLGGDPEKLF